MKRLRDEVLEFSIVPQGRGREARGEQAFEPGCRAIACGIVVMPSSGPGSRISAIIGAKGCASIRCTRDLGSTSGLQRREIKHILNRIRCLVADARLIDEPLACRNESDARFHGTFTTPPTRRRNRHKPGRIGPRPVGFPHGVSHTSFRSSLNRLRDHRIPTIPDHSFPPIQSNAFFNPLPNVD